MSHWVSLITVKQGTPQWWNGGSWRCAFQRVPLVTGHIHLDFAPRGFCLPHFLPATAKPEEISLCRCWAPAIMRFEGHQSASFIDQMKNRPEMQMSHCADEHESASSGAWAQRDETSLDSWEVWNMSWWICFKDKLFVSKSRYKSCCDERLQGGLQSEKWHFLPCYESVGQQGTESNTHKTKYCKQISQQGEHNGITSRVIHLF